MFHIVVNCVDSRTGDAFQQYNGSPDSFHITQITFKCFTHVSSNGSTVPLILTDAAEMDAFNSWKPLWSLPDTRHGSFVPQTGQGLIVVLEYVKAEIILQSKFNRIDTSNT